MPEPAKVAEVPSSVLPLLSRWCDTMVFGGAVCCAGGGGGAAVCGVSRVERCVWELSAICMAGHPDGKLRDFPTHCRAWPTGAEPAHERVTGMLMRRTTRPVQGRRRGRSRNVHRLRPSGACAPVAVNRTGAIESGNGRSFPQPGTRFVGRARRRTRKRAFGNCLLRTVELTKTASFVVRECRARRPRSARSA